MAFHLEQALILLQKGGAAMDDPLMDKLRAQIEIGKRDPQYQIDRTEHFKAELTTKLSLLKSHAHVWDSYRNNFLEGQIEAMVSAWNQTDGVVCGVCNQIQPIIVDYSMYSFYLREHRNHCQLK